MNSSVLIVLIGLFALAACDHHDLSYYMFQPNEVTGTWYFNGSIGCPSSSNWCIPTGIINISTDLTNSSQFLMQSTAWNGSVCEQMGINSSSSMALPFANGSTLMDITMDYTQFNSQQVEIRFIDPIIVTPANNSDLIRVLVSFNFWKVTNFSDDVCQFMMNKAASEEGEGFVSGFLGKIGSVF